MTMQTILRIAGIAFLAIGLLFAILAIHYYLTNDIRGVMDDLSGKARAKGLAGARGRAAEARRGNQQARRSGALAKTPAVTKGAVTEAKPQEAWEATGAAPGFPVPMVDEEDDMGTIVVDIDPAAWAQATSEPTDVSARMPHGAAGTVTFQVKRSIVLFDSNQIIAAQEEM